MNHLSHLPVYLRLVLALLLIGAVGSGIETRSNLEDLQQTYAAAAPGLRRFMLYGPNVPLLDKVELMVPRTEGIVLETEVDPALLAYGLFPHPVWQPEADPEMRFFFLDAGAPLYPRRAVTSFAAQWYLRVTPESLPLGGELFRLSRQPGGR